MTDQELIHKLHTFAGKPVDYAELVGSPVPSSYGISFVYEDPESYCMVAAAERIEEKNTIITALQSENAEKDKEIKRLTKKATLNAFIKYAMKRACEELVDTGSALSRVEAERDAAIADVPHDCEHCKYAEVNGACKLLPDGDEFSPDYIDGFDRDGNCDHWEWRGAQGEG